MDFIINRELIDGKYYVKVKYGDLSAFDKEKARKFGYPEVRFRNKDGRYFEIVLDALYLYDDYGFPDREEAETYYNDMVTQLEKVKKAWESLSDDWSSTNTI